MKISKELQKKVKENLKREEALEKERLAEEGAKPPYDPLKIVKKTRQMQVKNINTLIGKAQTNPWVMQKIQQTLKKTPAISGARI